MRFFAVVGDPPYVVAEVVGGFDEETDACTDRDADLIGFASFTLLTDEELSRSQAGRKALAAWYDRDDTRYEDASRRQAHTVITEDRRLAVRNGFPKRGYDVLVPPARR
jgi:hypothetical protein